MYYVVLMDLILLGIALFYAIRVLVGIDIQQFAPKRRREPLER